MSQVSRRRYQRFLTSKMLFHLFFIVLCISGLRACPSVCNCRTDYVDCSNRGLTSVPSFSAADKIGVNFHTLDVSKNRIKYLTSNTFSNAPFRTVLLSHNELNSSKTSIPDNAFAGAQSSIETLDLSNNRLSELPVALTTLSKISSLNVIDNPISRSVDFTYSAMKAMGDTMHNFKFGSRYLDEWPRTLDHFQELQSLTVDGLGSRMRVVPPDGFHGFETTILELTIKNTGLIAVPIGISKLRNMRTLHFDNNPDVHDRGILVQSFPIIPGHHRLRELSLKYDGLTKFPAVIKYLRALETLSLDGNALDFVNDATLIGNITANKVTLRNCQLDRVPAALSEIHYLQTLDLSQNPIRTIEKNDLKGLQRLNHFIVSNSSLEYISDDSFSELHNLVSLNFERSNITEVPKALSFISPCLRDLFIERNKLDCMCESLVWLKGLSDGCRAKGTPVNIHGNCDTIISTVSNYVATFIPNCPQYKEEHHMAPYNG